MDIWVVFFSKILLFVIFKVHVLSCVHYDVFSDDMNKTLMAENPTYGGHLNSAHDNPRDVRNDDANHDYDDEVSNDMKQEVDTTAAEYDVGIGTVDQEFKSIDLNDEADGDYDFGLPDTDQQDNQVTGWFFSLLSLNIWLWLCR